MFSYNTQSNNFLLAALAVSLFAQTTGDLFSGIWAILFMASAYMAGPEKNKTALVLLVFLIFHTFYMRVYSGSLPFFWSAAAIPLIVMTRYNRDYLIKMASYIILIFSINLILQYYFYPPAYYNNQSAWPMLNPNNAAMIANVGFMIFYDRRKYLFALLCLAGMLHTESMGGLAALFAGIIIYHRLWWALCILPVFVYFGWGAFEGRLEIWAAALKIFQANPLWGTGAGSFPVYYNKIRTEAGTYGTFAHNDIIQIMCDMGLIGLIIWCIFYIRSFKTAGRMGQAAAGCVLIQSLVSFSLYIPPLCILLGILLKGNPYGRESKG